MGRQPVTEDHADIVLGPNGGSVRILGIARSQTPDGWKAQIVKLFGRIACKAEPTRELITFLDVETPNKRNDRICSIGLEQTDLSGNVVEKRSILVDPEAPFDDVNMRIHHICPIDVRGAMTFPEAWRNVIHPMLSGRVVAHNARFDLCVLSKSLIGYGMEPVTFTYADTLAMARDALRGLPDFKLPTVCEEMGIRMGTHHRADADTEACRMVFWGLVGRGLDASMWFQTYRYRQPDYSERPRGKRELTDETASMKFFKEALERVLVDGVVSPSEAMTVLGLIHDLPPLSDNAAIMTVAEQLQEALFDGELSISEAEEIARAFTHIIDPTDGASGNDCSEVEFQGRLFVLSGSFEHGSKRDVEDFIKVRGGGIKSDVSKKVDYVVIGGYGSEAYALGSYGTKGKKALEFQAKGVPIRVISERELFGE